MTTTNPFDFIDPRCVCRTTYRFLDLIFIALAATIAGAEDPKAIAVFAAERRVWLSKYCQLPVDPESGEILAPSHDTFERLLARLDPVAFVRCFGRWAASLAEHLGLKQIAIDGKCLRGSGSTADGLKALHLVQAWSAENQLCLGQVAVEEKSNEITAMPVILDLLDLKGALVTVDAMGCQRAVAAKVVDKGGDYLLPIKGNQEKLREEIEFTFTVASALDFEGIEHDSFETLERGHGRLERTTYIVIYNLKLIGEQDKWMGLQAIGLCIRERTEGGVTSFEELYFMGSKRMSAKDYANGLRGHWGIENKFHWHLDVSLSEDDSQVADRNAAQNQAALRRQALALLQRHPSKLSIAKKRYKAILSETYLVGQRYAGLSISA